MMKSEAGKNTAPGATPSTELNMASVIVDDPFLDSYQQEVFACHEIIDKLRLKNGSPVTITFQKEFLLKIVRSHIAQVRIIVKK